MWQGDLEGKHAGENLIRFIDGHSIESLHTSGHAYVETIAMLIDHIADGSQRLH